MAATDKIIAAGAVVTRQGPKGPEYLLVYRDYRDDWTFPKGKVESGEHILGAAIREVREETGFAIVLGIPLPTQTYKIEGRIKDSHYWVAQLLSGTFVPNDEVDEIAWLTFDEAAKRLTYEHDIDVLKAAARFLKVIKEERAGQLGARLLDSFREKAKWELFDFSVNTQKAGAPASDHALARTRLVLVDLDKNYVLLA